MPKLRFDRIRTKQNGLETAFEELVCQIFRRAPEAPVDGRFRRIEGSGGDGGVEAIWIAPNGIVWGIQAKNFNKLGDSQKKQMRKSLDQAVANYPELNHYTYCLPISLTGKKGAKSNKQKKGMHEKLESWLEEWRSDLKKDGRSIELDYWEGTELEGRLVTADPSGGIRRYWFDLTIFTDEWFSNHLGEVIAQAGKRYTPELSVQVPLHSAFEAFGRTDSWLNRLEEMISRLKNRAETWRRILGTPLNDQYSGPVPSENQDASKQIMDCVWKVVTILEDSIEFPENLTSSGLRDNLKSTLENSLSLEKKIKSSLEELHGANADTPGFRQYSAEYQVSFPMAPLDSIRELITEIQQIFNLVDSQIGNLPSSSIMLVHGPAGIGKTHAAVDILQDRFDRNLLSTVVFGEDFSDNDPWTRIIAKLGLSGTIGRDEFLDALNAAGESSGRPFILFVDALNETQPDRRRWANWLPPMIKAVEKYSFLKLCVTCRDTYLRDVVPSWQSIPNVVHNGFAGREYDAISQFFQHYGLGPPSEPLLQEEFANPLFLHLVCESIQETDGDSLPVGTVGLTAIIDTLLILLC